MLQLWCNLLKNYFYKLFILHVGQYNRKRIIMINKGCPFYAKHFALKDYRIEVSETTSTIQQLLWKMKILRHLQQKLTTHGWCLLTEWHRLQCYQKLLSEHFQFGICVIEDCLLMEINHFQWTRNVPISSGATDDRVHPRLNCFDIRLSRLTSHVLIMSIMRQV